jgi:SRSO17 transposase
MAGSWPRPWASAAPAGSSVCSSLADWDQDAVRDDLRAYVLAHLGADRGILVVDETGFREVWQEVSRSRATVQRDRGPTRELPDRRLFASQPARRAPPSWIGSCTCQKNGRRTRYAAARRASPRRWLLPPRVYSPSGCWRALISAGVRAEWVVGDTVYGYEELRSWLERLQQPYVLAVPETHPVWMQGRAQPVGLIAALLPQEAWTTLSAGEGSQGPRLYDWTWLEVDAEPTARGSWRSWILIRRSLSQPNKRAYYRAWGPPEIQLSELVRVAGRRWTIEEGIEEAKGEVGLDQYEVRTWTGWYRHVTLALLAHALLVVLRAQAREETKKGVSPSTRSD